MYHILNFYAFIYFLKFVIHEMNSEMMVLTERENANVTNADVAVS
jgi:hypothetical protein